MKKYRDRRLFLFLAQKIAGLSGLQVAVVLVSNGAMSPEEIAELTGLQLTFVRDILEKLSASGLVVATKTEESEKGVSFKYYVDRLAVNRAFRDRLKTAIIHLSKMANYSGVFYYCEMCMRHYPQEVAVEHEYRCPVCGSQLVEDVEFTRRLKKVRSVVEELKAKFVQTMYA